MFDQGYAIVEGQRKGAQVYRKDDFEYNVGYKCCINPKKRVFPLKVKNTESQNRPQPLHEPIGFQESNLT